MSARTRTPFPAPRGAGPRTCILVLGLAATLLLPGHGTAARSSSPDFDAFTGRIGYFAAVVDPDADAFAPLQSVGRDVITPYPLASSFKPMILYEVLRAVDREELRWGERIDVPVAWHSLDGGPIPPRAKVARLARQMIFDSHNTATDVLFKTVGLGAPLGTLGDWNLRRVRILLPTREFWVALAGLVPEIFPEESLPAAAEEFAAADRGDQVETIRALQRAAAGFDARTIERESDDFYALEDHDRETTFAILDDIDNVASPRQTVELYHRLFLADDLSDRSRRRFRRLMRKGDGAIDRELIRVPLAYWGGKGGDDLGMGSMAGYALTRRGNHVIYAVMGAHMRREDADWRILEETLTWIFDTLDAG